MFDLETTGGKAADGGITEIGAVKLRGGECVGTYQTLVNPGRAIPPEITVLTGITTAMVVRAPRIEAVLPSFLDFVGDDIARATSRDDRRCHHLAKDVSVDLDVVRLAVLKLLSERCGLVEGVFALPRSGAMRR